jgi:hypothetical protein
MSSSGGGKQTVLMASNQNIFGEYLGKGLGGRSFKATFLLYFINILILIPIGFWTVNAYGEDRALELLPVIIGAIIAIGYAVHTGLRKNVKGYRRERAESVSRRLPHQRTIMRRIIPSPFRSMILLYLGLGVSLAYCLLGTALLFYLGGQSEGLSFFAAYTTSFKTIFSLGIILGTALIIFRSQSAIPDTIEAAFTETQLSATDYFYFKRCFASPRRSISFTMEFTVVGFVIFSYCQFPLSRLGGVLMLIAACAEYALGMYVIRKLFYTVMMLHSLRYVTVNRNLFRKRELDAVVPYVLVASTLTGIFVCVHVLGYYRGPFLYGSIFGQSIKTFLLLPVLVGIPTLFILSFYPRVVLQKVYEQSIDVEIRRIKKALRPQELNAYEKRTYLMEFDRRSRDEMNSSLKWTALEALPTWITILITALGLSLGK